MTLVMGVDSSTQSCKVVITDADTGAIVRDGPRVASGRHRGAPGRVVVCAARGDHGCRRARRRRRVGDRRAAARHGRPRRGRPGHPRRPAVERHAFGRSRGRPHRGVRCRGARPAHGPRARRLLHDHEAPLAARSRTRERRAGRRGRPAARLADLAPARLRSGGRVAARAGARRARHGPIGCLGHRLLGPVERRLRPRPPRRGARPRRDPPARAGPDGVGRGRGGPPRRRRRGRQRRRRPGARSRPGRCRGLDRHERHGLRRQRAAHDRPDRHRRRLRRLHRALPPARRDPQRGARADRDRRAPRRRPRRAQPPRPGRRSPARRDCRSSPTSRASARRTCPTRPRRSPA